MGRVRFIAIAAGATLALTVSALPAGAGSAAPILTIDKVVNGPVPAGTQFVVTVDCDGDIIRPGGPGSSSGQRTFDAQGNPVTSPNFEFVDTGECTVTETQTGGAASVSYECVGVVPPQDLIEGTASGRFAGPPIQLLPCQTSGPQSEPITVNIVEDGQATVTVTNTFVDPGAPAAAPVPGTPRFTG